MVLRRALIALALALPGCSSSDAGSTLAEGKVDEGGGRVASADGEVSLTFPPQAVSGDTAIAVRRVQLAETPEGVIPGTVVELGPDGSAFAEPVELALRYRPEDVPNPESRWLRVVQIRPDGTLGRTAFVGHDRAARLVKARLAHFSSYALADLKIAEASFESSEARANKLDLLVLVDNSRSMLGEQQSLADNFPRLARKLDDAGLDYRVGVISPTLGAGPHTHVMTCERPGGDQGKLQATARLPGCTTPRDPWIAKHGADSNVPGGDIEAAFSCIASLGTEGCGFEQPLEAIHRALEARTNPGFLRDDAALGLLVITDEDDCSAANPDLYDVRNSALGRANFRCFEQGVVCEGTTPETAREPGPRTGCKPREDGMIHPISRYVERVRQLKPQGNVVVSLVAGPVEPVSVRARAKVVDVTGVAGPDLAPSCSMSVTARERSEAFPAIRLRAFAEAFGAERSSFTPICEQDFSPALEEVGDLLVRAQKLSWCLPYDPEDAEATSSEIEADCDIEAAQLAEVAACQGQQPTEPCYRVLKNDACPRSDSQLELLNVDPSEMGEAPVRITCLVP